MKQNMKQINRIKEVSELFHIPSSALRYWDDEGLVRFERTADNNYRRPTSQTIYFTVPQYRDVYLRCNVLPEPFPVH